MSSIETFEKLGTGESTAVYRGYDTTLERNVAVKELDPVARNDVRRREQFYREAQFLAQHQDENILTVYSVDRDRGWIVMELMKGTLASQVAAGPLAPDLVRSVLQQVLRALNFLHKRGKIHGKVRPSNILINDAGQVKLSDFEETDPNGELRIPAGSKKYLAPELLRREFGAFGPNLDLYCLGFTALELLKGPGFDQLFPGTGADAIDADTAWMRWHTSEEELASCGALIPGLPEDLRVVIDKMLHKQVSERPPSAQAALDLLKDTPLKPVIIESSIPVVATAAEPTPVSTTPFASGYAAPPTKPAKPGPRGKENSRDKANDILGRWYVLYPLCALMLLGAVFIGLKLRKGGAPTELPITLRVEPGDAAVSVDGKSIPPNADGAYVLKLGKHTIALTKEGFRPHETEIEITADSKELGPFALARLETAIEPAIPDPQPIDPPAENKLRVVDFQIEPADAVAVVSGKRLALTNGRGRLDLPASGEIVVEVSHPAHKPFAHSYPPAELEEVFNKITVKLEPSAPPVEARSKLPPGLIAVADAELDERSGLPRRTRVAALEEAAPLELTLIHLEEGTIGVDGPRMPGEIAAKNVQPSRPYYIALTETTNEQYALFSAQAGEETAGTTWRETWDESGRVQNLPVVNVHWDQAAAFCQWAGGELPSEVEWELAARDGLLGGFPYPWGDEPADATRCNLFFGENANEKEYRLAPVDSLPAGAAKSGLLHMLGNAAEWCRDKYTAGEGETPDSPEFAGQYVVRGCSSAKAAAEDARITYRAPEKKEGAADVGFRLMVPVP